MAGEFEPEFTKELRTATNNVHEGKIDARSDLIFMTADSAKSLTSAINKTAKAIQGAAGLWIVYPKGKKEITENDVISAGRKAGLKDVKVVGFSATHTALKFVLPLDRR